MQQKTLIKAAVETSKLKTPNKSGSYALVMIGKTRKDII
tara:strand:+ start:447 stop:563 length:117 start_codon:yes stop_codon:yes gene_type:complete